jgi:hydroxyacylglutathione hydrolase
MVNVRQVGGLGFDSNIYLILDEVVALIDAGTGMNFDRVKENLQRFGAKSKDIELLINTHCHYDHAGGDPAFLKTSNCELAIHELDAEPLRAGDGAVTLAANFGTQMEPLEPTRILREDDKIELGSLALEVMHTPGHTRGSISLYEREKKMLFSGDTVFCGGVGRVDLPTGDLKAMRKSLQRLEGLEVQELLPGHGPTAEKGGGRHIEAALRTLSVY